MFVVLLRLFVVVLENFENPLVKLVANPLCFFSTCRLVAMVSCICLLGVARHVGVWILLMGICGATFLCMHASL